MGKQVIKKAVETAAKKSGGTRMKAPSLAKKSEKKKAENSSAVDLRQPKDRDPIQQRVDLLIPDLHKLYKQGLLTSDIIELAVDYSQRHEIGNELFRAWNDDYLQHWNQPCNRFDAQFNDHFGTHTCESKVEEIFTNLDDDWEQVFRFLITCFDIDNVEKYTDEYMWSVRCLGMRVAQQEPFAFFDINSISNPDNSPNSIYWANEVPGNPRLNHEFSMGAFWMMCSIIFDHPWTHTYNANRETDDEYLITSLEVCSIRDEAYAQLKALYATPHFPVFSAPAPKRRSGEKFFIQDLNLGDDDTEPGRDRYPSPAEEAPPPNPKPITLVDSDDEEENKEEAHEDVDENEVEGTAQATSAEGNDGHKDDSGKLGRDANQEDMIDESPEPEHGDIDKAPSALDNRIQDGWKFQQLETEDGDAGQVQSEVAEAEAPDSLKAGSDLNVSEVAANQDDARKVPPDDKAATSATQKRKPSNHDAESAYTSSIHTEVVTTNNEDEAISEMTGTTGPDKDSYSFTTPSRASGSSKIARTKSPMMTDSPKPGTSGSLDPRPAYQRLAHPGIPAPVNLASRIFEAPRRSTPTELTPSSGLPSNKPPPATKEPAKSTRKLTISERLASFRQVNLKGVEGDAYYFEVSFAMMFNGGPNLGDAWYQHVSEVLGEIIENGDHGLRILPIADALHRETGRWIRTKSDLKRLIPNFRAMGKYIDREYQNGPYLLSNSKQGEKKWRARMVFGYDSGTKPETVQSYLNEALKNQGRFCGAFPSPLQYGAIEKVGALCFYPREIDARNIEKEIMRKFDWKVPIGLRLDWVSMPYDNRTKWNERSPGLMIWHVYCRVEDSHIVDMTLRQWLHPSTPKSELPWAAVVVYISDWKAAQRGTISVRAYGPVKEQILTMVSKNRDFQDLTVVLYADIEIPGMLKKTTTRLFGESTFLKLLLSIKATPAQADKAAAADKTNNGKTPSLSNGDDDEDNSDDDEGFTKVKVGSKRRNKKKDPSLSSLMGEMDNATPAQIKAAAEADRKRQRDLDNHRPSPLFLMVLPGEMLGSYIFVCRIKYQTLAQNVLNGLVPFFTFHLREVCDAVNDKVLGKWLSKSAIHQARRRNLYWCTKELRAKEANSNGGNVDEGLEFLDDFGDDPTDVFDGTLEFDLDMADAKDIDDGATVAGALDELRDREAQLDDAYAEIAIKETQLDEERQRLAAKDSELEAARQREESLRETIRLLSAKGETSPALPSQANPDLQPNPSTTAVRKAKLRPKPSTVSPSDDSMPPPASKPVTGKRTTPPSPAHSTSRDTVTTVSSTTSVSSKSSLRTPGSKARRKLHPFFSGHTEAQPESDNQDVQGQPRGRPAVAPSLPAGDSFGDSCHVQRPNATRVVFQNLNGIPASATACKQEHINTWLKEERVGIALLAETNRHWPLIPEGQRWHDRMRNATTKGHYSAIASNKHFQGKTGKAVSSFRYGGCIASILNEVSHSAKESGSDPTGLGRWAFVRIRGKHFETTDVADSQSRSVSKDLIVVAAYRPNPAGIGTSTVWAQHKVYFNGIRRDIDPRDAFTTDLRAAIERWRNEGCEVILGVDANEDLSVFSNTSFRSKMRDIGMEEAILQRHPLNPPATYQRNSKSQPIDGLFTSPGVPVIAGGYYGFDEFVSSDHRGLWLDIDLSKCLGGHRPSKQSFHPRRLTCEDTPSVRRYLSYVLREYSAYAVPTRLEKIEEAILANDGNMTPSLSRKFNCLHTQMYAIRRKAEAQCRKRPSGKVPWSPPMQAYWDRLLLWKLLLKGRLKCRVSSRKLRRLMKKTGLRDAWRKSTTELHEALRQERKQYKEAKAKHADKWRKEHIERQLKVAKKKQWKSQKARERYQRLRRMKQREEARRRRRAQGKGFSGGLRAIQIESPAGGENRLRTIREQHLVEEGCRNENRARYDQTRFPHPTPPMQSPLYETFWGPDAEANSLAQLEGRLPCPEGLDVPTSTFLSYCRFKSDHDPVSMEVSLEDHLDFWSRANEKKGSEPHGLHNGHFKAAVHSRLIARCDTAMRNIPLQTGWVPAQWQNLMNFAIEKKAGDFRLSKMRTIQMMNSEFQANNKKMGRSAMQYAEKNQLIPPGQCGSRKEHMAIDLALSKRLIWDSLILQRRAAGWISNDAKSCFDRIVHWVAILAILRFGITWRATAMAFETLATSTHRVRTGFGDSPTPFFPPSDIPFQGCGQGNGAGPAIWVAVSSILITMMESKGFGFECLSAIDRQLVHAQCLAFIDDTDVTEAAKTVEESGESICPAVQRAASLWSGAIRATGGAINPEKSFWWLLDFEWNDTTGKWRFRSPDKMASNFELQIQGLSGELETLTRHSPSHAERTLGVMLAPLENPGAHEEYLRGIAKKWAESVRSGHLRRYDVIPLIKTTVMKSLEYPMALTTLDEDQWRSICWPFLEVCLPKAGVNRNFPKEARTAPISLQGLGIPNAFACQVKAHLDMLLRHPANHTDTAAYLEANLQAHQLETGTSFGLLQQIYENTAILASETWLKRIWRELEALGIYVAFDSSALTLYREGDVLLIDLFIEAEVDQDDLLWLNWCRVHLHVCTLSDIVTADGKRIRQSCWNGIRDNCASSAYDWPRTVSPQRRHWKLWQSTLSAILLRSEDPDLPLRKPLGDWHDDLSRWNWQHSPSQGLFHRHGHIWVRHRKMAGSRRSRRFESAFSVWTLPLPHDLQRATVSLPRDRFKPQLLTPSLPILLTGTAAAAPPVEHTPSLLRAWREHSSRCTAYHGWVPAVVRIEGDEATLAAALLSGDLRMISDGSCKDEVGTAATQLVTKCCRHRVIIESQTPGLPRDQTSHRSELSGIHQGMMVADWLLEEWGPPPTLPSKQRRNGPIVRVACDGLSPLRHSFESKPLSPTQADFDLLSTIRNRRLKSKLRWRARHVRAHQDAVSTCLTWWELRNIEVDAWAGNFRRALPRDQRLHPPNPRFFLEPAALFIDDIKQSRLNPERLQELVALPSLRRERWCKAPLITPAAEAETDWANTSRFMKALAPKLQRWTAKHVSGMCGVGKILQHFGTEESAGCPLCGLDEDHLHVPRCCHPTAKVAWDRSIALLSQWLDRTMTAPLIKAAILAILKEVRQPEATPLQNLPEPIQAAHDSQRVIGCQGLLEGRLSSHWLPLQEAHFDSLQSRRSGRLWASRLSQQLIQLGFSMWDHRNSVRHSDDSYQAKIQLRELDAGINQEFDLGPSDLPRKIRAYLDEGRRAVLRKPLDDKAIWLNLVRTERAKFRRRVSYERGILHNFLTFRRRHRRLKHFRPGKSSPGSHPAPSRES